MRKFATLIAGLAFAALACAQSASIYAPPAQDKATTEFDEFSPSVTVRSPKHDEGNLEDRKVTYLHAEVDRKDGSIGVVLSFINVYSAASWRHWNIVGTDRGETLKIIPAQRSVLSCSGGVGCTYAESILIKLPPELLSRAAKEPTRLKVSSAAGEYVYSFDAGEVQSLLSTISEVKTKLGK